MENGFVTMLETLAVEILKSIGMQLWSVVVDIAPLLVVVGIILYVLKRKINNN